jgi:hypothetical protein
MSAYNLRVNGQNHTIDVDAGTPLPTSRPTIRPARAEVRAASDNGFMHGSGKGTGGALLHYGGRIGTGS